MPSKMPRVRTPPFWITAAGRRSTFAAAGWWTSSYQKTAKASVYQCAPAVPTISVTALLRLADWLHQRRAPHGGTPSCPTPTDPLCPPHLTTPQELWPRLAPPQQQALLRLLSQLLQRHLLPPTPQE